MGIEIAVILSHAGKNQISCTYSLLIAYICLQYFCLFFVCIVVCFPYVLFTTFQYYIYIYVLDYTNKDYCNLENEQQPEYCVAAKTDRNGRMIKEIRDCKTKLPALCSGSEVADVNTNQSSIHGKLSPIWSRLC
jgi:hypothetical protein